MGSRGRRRREEEEEEYVEDSTRNRSGGLEGFEIRRTTRKKSRRSSGRGALTQMNRKGWRKRGRNRWMVRRRMGIKRMRI